MEEVTCTYTHIPNDFCLTSARLQLSSYRVTSGFLSLVLELSLYLRRYFIQIVMF